MDIRFSKLSSSLLVGDRNFFSKNQMYLYLSCVPQRESQVSQVPPRYPNMGYPGGPKNVTL